MATYKKLPADEYGSYAWLRRETSGFLGYGYNPDTMDEEKASKIESFIQSGVMQFYYHPPLPVGDKGEVMAHRWSFLTPVAELPLVNGVSEYDLPEDCAGAIEEFTAATVGTDIAGGPAKISVVDEPSLRQLQQTSQASGLPKYAALRPLRSEGDTAQRWQVVFYPTPNDTRTLSYRYTIAPPPIGEDRKWPYGGKQHAETILQSCLAVAEQRETKDANGPATARFMQRLAASIQFDKLANEATDDGMWPVNGLPTDLTIDLDYLRRLVGRHMGVTAHPATWTSKQSEEVSEAIRGGLRRFYTPAVLPGEKYAHEWSFLRPKTTYQTVADVWEYDLPDDFAFIDGPMTYDPGSSTMYPPVRRVSEHQVRTRHQQFEHTGRPEWFAIRVKPDVDGGGTRWQLLVWPTPDDDYSLHYRYRTNPGLLSSGIAKPVGGMPHAQTVIESCLMAADAMLGIKDAGRQERYMELLRSSVSHDRNANAPDTLGRIRDASDGVDDDDWRDHFASPVTYNSVAY